MVLTKAQANFNYFLMMTRLQRVMVALRYKLHGRVGARKLQQTGKRSFFNQRESFVLHWFLNSFQLTHHIHCVGVEAFWHVVKVHVFRRLVPGEAPCHRIAHLPVAVVKVGRVMISTVP